MCSSLSTGESQTSEPYSSSTGKCVGASGRVILNHFPHWHRWGTRSCGSSLPVVEELSFELPPKQGGTCLQSLQLGLISSNPHRFHHCRTKEDWRCDPRMVETSRESNTWGVRLNRMPWVMNDGVDPIEGYQHISLMTLSENRSNSNC